MEVNLHGRKFTWFKSRLDRAFVNDRWIATWQDSELRGLPRSVSDHCAIVLSTKNIDWGPKPFRFVNAWTTNPDFRDKVEGSWREGGWGSFVLKEKLKRLKEALKEWSRR